MDLNPDWFIVCEVRKMNRLSNAHSIRIPCGQPYGCRMSADMYDNSHWTLGQLAKGNKIDQNPAVQRPNCSKQ